MLSLTYYAMVNREVLIVHIINIGNYPVCLYLVLGDIKHCSIKYCCKEMKTNLKHNYKLANKHEFVLYLYVKLWMAITKLKQYNLNVKIKCYLNMSCYIHVYCNELN